MSRERMAQCILEKRLSDENVRWQTTWLPEKFCKLGMILRLQNEDGSWEDGFRVMSIGPFREEKAVHERSRDWKRQRRASDI